MASYKTVWKSPLRIGVALGTVIGYSAFWVNGFTDVERLFFGGIAVILITIILFAEG